MKILILGASGMIGSSFVRVLSERTDWQVYGTTRGRGGRQHFSDAIEARIVADIDVGDRDSLVRLFAQIRPDVVINCIGLTKHHKESEDPLLAIPLNALLPHRLADLCAVTRARLIQISTDCVFSGVKGGYVEGDPADAKDIYGKTKILGEVNYPHTITLRTSTIGHELNSKYGLLEWFLSQEGKCKGYTRAVFSGLPTAIFAQVVRDVVIPRVELSGLYHIAAKPINKFSLLQLIADAYGKKIDIVPDGSLEIDRSLDASRFRTATGYIAPNWHELIALMYADNKKNGVRYV